VFLKVAASPKGMGAIVTLKHPSGRVIRMRMPIHHRRGVGQTCPEGLTPTPNGGCADPSTYAGAKALAASTPQATDYPQAPGCHVVSLANNTCMADNGTKLPCTFITECDPITGSVHCQLPIPGGNPPGGDPVCGPGQTPSTASSPAATTLTSGTAYVPTGAAIPQAPVAKPSVPYGGFTQPASSTPASTQAPTIAQLASLFNPPTTVYTGNPSCDPSTQICAETGSAQPVAAPSSGFDLSFLTNSVNIFGMSIPVWLIGGAVILGGVLLLGGKK
jgi:hypothetical protein